MSASLRINPIMVVLARESRGWTQTDLANAIGVSQAKICKYELGTLEVSQIDLDAITRVLNYSSRFFEQADRIYDPSSSLLFYRKRVAVPVKVQRRICAEMNVRKMQIAQLVRAASVETEHRFPSIQPEECGDSARRVAQRVRQIWNLSLSPIPDLTRVVEEFGGVVILMDFGTRLVDGTHLFVSGLPPIFFMNNSVPGERYRFSLAHEVGHAIMHRSASRDEEADANEFASELLMPRRVISTDLRNLNLNSAGRLKQVWRVSIAALIRRARDLNQIPESTYRRLFTRLSATGQRTNEPWAIPMERPSLFERLLEFHKSNLDLNENDLNEMLFTDSLGPIERPAGRKSRLRIVNNEESS